MIIFFDTETTGLPVWDKPSEHPQQPHIVQISAMCHNDAGEKIWDADYIIKPDGWVIPPELTKIHGISQERALSEGKDAKETLGELFEKLTSADLIVGHGVKFDMRMMRIECMRHALGDAEMLAKKPIFCTMTTSSPIVNLPPTAKMLAAGYNKPKVPKLGEAYKFFFNEELQGAHNSQVDMEACARIYYELQKRDAA